MDLTPVDIVGKRCYHFIHAEDVEGIRHSHLDCKYLHFFVKIIWYNIRLFVNRCLYFLAGSLYLAAAFFITGFHRG